MVVVFSTVMYARTARSSDKRAGDGGIVELATDNGLRFVLLLRRV